MPFTTEDKILIKICLNYKATMLYAFSRRVSQHTLERRPCLQVVTNAIRVCPSSFGQCQMTQCPYWSCWRTRVYTQKWQC